MQKKTGFRMLRARAATPSLAQLGVEDRFHGDGAFGARSAEGNG
jgi:hypothetical protein